MSLLGEEDRHELHDEDLEEDKEEDGHGHGHDDDDDDGKDDEDDKDDGEVPKEVPKKDSDSSDSSGDEDEDDVKCTVSVEELHQAAHADPKPGEPMRQKHREAFMAITYTYDTETLTVSVYCQKANTCL